MAEAAYMVNPQVMHETIDGETIIIDLATGTYYSLRGSGPAVWAAVARGAGRSGIVEALERSHDTAPGTIAPAVDSFLEQLEKEQLIAQNGNAAAASELVEQAAGTPFEEPRLERYDDLQDVILLDPVHQVDDRGWPHPATVGERS
jgi:Coenzyme PQQ synthesis protein D (PqqD)